MSDEKKSVIMQNLTALSDLDNFQKYVLGTKKNGAPRALFDVVKEYTSPSKKDKKKDKKKKNKDKDDTTYAFYLNSKKGKKKKHKKNKHWHI